MAHNPRYGIVEAYKAAQIDSAEKLKRRLEPSSIPPLIGAILANDEEELERLLEMPEVEKTINDGLSISRDYTPLILACGYRYMNMVRRLVLSGVDINKVIRADITPLAVAIQTGDQELVQYLVEENGAAVSPSRGRPDGAGISAATIGVDSSPLSPIHVACFFGHKQIVQYLVETAQVSVCEQDGYGVTPLLMAVMMNKYDVASYLLDAFPSENEDNACRLSINHKSVRGETALTICMQNYADPPAQALAKRLLDCGANPHVPFFADGRSESPLCLAVENADYDFVRHLVDHSSPPQGMQLTCVARALKLSLAREKKFANLLLRRVHADPNYSFDTHTNDTSMHELGRILERRHWTDRDYERDMINLFLRHSGDVTCKNDMGETFLSLIDRRKDLWPFVPPLAAKLRDSGVESTAHPRRETRVNSKKKRVSSDAAAAPQKTKKNTRKKSEKRSGGKVQRVSRDAGLARRRKTNKRKREKRAQSKAEDSTVPDIPSSVLDVHLSDLSCAGTTSVSTVESVDADTPSIGSSLLENESFGFTTIRSRAQRTKNKTRTKTTRSGKSKSKRTELAVHNVWSSATTPQGQRSGRPVRATNRSLSGPIPANGNQRRIEQDRSDAKPKPPKVLGNSWNNVQTSHPISSGRTTNAVSDTEIEPRETSRRGMSGMEDTNEFPAPNVPARLLSPRDSVSVRSASPSSRKSPSVDSCRGPQSAPALAPIPLPPPERAMNGGTYSDDVLTRSLEEKFVSEDFPMTVAPTTRKPVPSQPTRPPMTSGARPSKPPKIVGGSLSMDAPGPNFFRSSARQTVISPAKTHAVTFPTRNGGNEYDTPPSAQTDHSSKSGHSSESMGSGHSSPASSQQPSISIAIQTDPVPSPLMQPTAPTDTPPVFEAQPQQSSPHRSPQAFIPQQQPQTMHVPHHLLPTSGLIPQPITSVPQVMGTIPTHTPTGVPLPRHGGPPMQHPSMPFNSQIFHPAYMQNFTMLPFPPTGVAPGMFPGAGFAPMGMHPVPLPPNGQIPLNAPMIPYNLPVQPQMFQQQVMPMPMPMPINQMQPPQLPPPHLQHRHQRRHYQAPRQQQRR